MNTCTISRRRPFQLIVGFPKLQCEGLPRLEISLRELHQFIQPLALVVAAYGLVQRDHHTSSTGLLSGDHEGKGCRSTRPFESSTYFFTRLLTWLPSLSTARCNSLWQRYVFLSLSSSLMNSSRCPCAPRTPSASAPSRSSTPPRSTSCGWFPEYGGASVCLFASSRSPLWGWSPAWSRPGKTIPLPRSFAGHPRASRASPRPAPRSFSRAVPDAASSSGSRDDGARGGRSPG